MVSEEIIVALKNAVNNGESLEQAMQVMISSGYDQREVHEASSFVGQGAITNLQSNSGEHLTMPGSVAPLQNSPQIHQTLPQQPQQMQQPQTQQPIRQQNSQMSQQPVQQPVQQIQQPSQQSVTAQSTSPEELQKLAQAEVPMQESAPVQKKEKPKKPKKSYFKEIILLVILLTLIGILVTTIMFKDAILGWFS